MKTPDKTENAAVLVLHELSTDSLILTKRSIALRHHPGEICFPGGIWEVQDENLCATALREVQEELGIASQRITILGQLNPESTLLGKLIHPWLANIQSIQPYRKNPDEVDSLISIPISLVVDLKNYKPFLFTISGKQIKSCIFVPFDGLIWGATARIMRQLAKKTGSF